MKLPALPVADPLSTLNFERLAASVEPVAVASLPAAPRDGQVIDYVADAIAGVVWRLRYRAASASAYKWEFVGGSPLTNEVATQQAGGAAGWQDLGTVGPSITAPLAGDYMVGHGCSALWGSNAGVSYYAGVNVSGTPGFLPTRIQGAATTLVPQARRGSLSSIAAGAAVKQQVNNGGGTVTAEGRWLEMVPVRVG